MSTEAKRAGNARHLEKLGRIDLRPYKEEVELVQAAAEDEGQSTSAYIMQAVRERMQREGREVFSLQEHRQKQQTAQETDKAD